MEFYELIDSVQENDLKKLCIINNITFLTQETIEKILNKYPEFFDNISVNIAIDDLCLNNIISIPQSYEKPTTIHVDFSKNLDASTLSMPMESLLCP